MEKILTKKEVLKLCKYYMYEIWGEKYNIDLKVSKQLVRALGYFAFREDKPIMIKFAYNLFENYKSSTIESVIKHELCHYHLFMNKQPHKDGHPVFEKELIRIGGSTTRSIPLAGNLYNCVCEECGEVVSKYATLKKAQKCCKDYVCGKCKGKLMVVQKQKEDTFKRIESQIKSKHIEEVLRMSDMEVDNYINGISNTPEMVEAPIEMVAEIPSKFDITKYVEVKSKKGPTQGNVYDTMVKLIDLQDIKGLRELHKLYKKHYDNCIFRHYLSKKREQFLANNGLI